MARTPLNAWTGSLSDQLAHFSRCGLKVCANSSHDDLYAVRGGERDEDGCWSGGELVAQVDLDWDGCDCGCATGEHPTCDAVHLDGLSRLWAEVQAAAETA